METATKSNGTKIVRNIVIICTFIVATGSISWYAKNNWFKDETPEMACNLSQTSVYEKYKYTVPIIFTEYVYEVSIKGSAPIQFTSSDYDWTVYENGVSPITISGTAFFVSDRGQLITNKHVVEPWSYNEEVASLTNTLTYFFPANIKPGDVKKYIKENWSKRYDYEGDGDEYVEHEVPTKAAIEASKVEDSSEETASNLVKEALTETPVATEQEMQFITNADIKVTPKRVRMYIALHGTDLTEANSIQCRVVELSQDNAIDVALIQTKDKKMPAQVKEYIHLDQAKLDDQSVKPGTKAFMLGYPMGTTLASTKKGIRVQIYEGQVNKESDGTSLQYNITSTHGASGSPVINDCGQLIAVNYAGFDVAQGFNFGIAAKHALELYKKN